MTLRERRTRESRARRQHGPRTTERRRSLSRLAKAKLEAMIAEATVDCYDESEQIGGWATMIEDNLAVPFQTVVLGAPVTVERVDLNRDGQIVAICARGRDRQALPILDLPLPSPLPKGADWIDAYRYWLRPG